MSRAAERVRRPESGADESVASDGDRASPREMRNILIYFASLVAASDMLNVRLGIEIMTAAVLVAAVCISGKGTLFLRDWWFFLLGLVMWNLSGPIAAQSPFPSHLDFMLNIDRAIFSGHDPVVLVQHSLAPTAHVDILDYLSGIAYNMHVPEPYIVGYVLWRCSRTIYLQFAASALILLVLGFATFILFPAVPPWMASAWFHRIPGVVNRFGLVLHSHPLPFHGTPLFYLFTFRGDAIAAFPSEHAAFPLLEFLALSRVVGTTVSVLLLAWVAWVLFTILYLGEHWITDALAGYVFAIVIWAGVRLITRARASDQLQPA